MFKVYKDEVPELFVTFFNNNSEFYEYYTRQRDHIHVPETDSNLTKFAIRYRGTIIWNNILKLRVDPNCSEAVFTKVLKKSIMAKTLSI